MKTAILAVDQLGYAGAQRRIKLTGSKTGGTAGTFLAGQFFALHQVEHGHQNAGHCFVAGLAGGFKNNRQQALHQFRIDRKSTRLNSSHVKISYAAFCLKKKRSTRKTST